MKRRVIILFAIWIVIELLALAWVYKQTDNDDDSTKERLTMQEVTPTRSVRLEGEVIHPYLGFVHDPTSDPAVNTYGFVGAGPVIASRSDDRFRVAVLGGSAAENLVRHGAQSLKEAIGTDRSRGRVELVNLACAGYRQPQPLLALSWALSLGSEFDAAILVDGADTFDVDEPPSESWQVYPTYPRNWAALASFTSDLRLERLMGEQTWIVSELRETGSGSVWPLRRFARRFRATRLEQRLAELQTELRELDSREQPRFRVTGPRMRVEGPEPAQSLVKSVWAVSSKQLAGLSAQNRIRFFHFQEAGLNIPPELRQALGVYDLTETFEPVADERVHAERLAEAIGRVVGSALSE